MDASTYHPVADDRPEPQAEDSLEQSDAGLRLDLVSLYKALGGGWDPPDESRPPSS